LDIAYEGKGVDKFPFLSQKKKSFLSGSHSESDENPRLASIEEENQERMKRGEVEGRS
jgi:hypothetical protein